MEKRAPRGINGVRVRGSSKTLTKENKAYSVGARKLIDVTGCRRQIEHRQGKKTSEPERSRTIVSGEEKGGENAWKKFRRLRNVHASIQLGNTTKKNQNCFQRGEGERYNSKKREEQILCFSK